MKDNAVLQCYEACKFGLPLLLARKLHLLDFESRKDAAQVWPVQQSSLSGVNQMHMKGPVGVPASP